MQERHTTDLESLSSPTLPTPNTMEHLPARTGEARERQLHRGGSNSRRSSSGNLREDILELTTLPTPTVFHVSMHDEPIDTFLAREEKSSTGQIGKSLGVALRMEMFPTPTTQDAKNTGGPSQFERNTKPLNTQVLVKSDWGKFEPAIRRWEQTIGLDAPTPTKPDGKEDQHRLSSEFTEWMMGLEPGWITSCGLTRNEELKACGNGVVPQQAELALTILLDGVALD